MTEDPYYTDSIVRPGCTHYRLRDDHTIVGYMQINPQGSAYFSKDNFWWRKSPIEFMHRDRSTETFDANRQMIFEHDLVVFKKGDGQYTKRGLVQFDATAEVFRINLLEEDLVILFRHGDPAAPFRDDLKVSGQLFAGQ